MGVESDWCRDEGKYHECQIHTLHFFSYPLLNKQHHLDSTNGAQRVSGHQQSACIPFCTKVKPSQSRAVEVRLSYDVRFSAKCLALGHLTYSSRLFRGVQHRSRTASTFAIPFDCNPGPYQAESTRSLPTSSGKRFSEKWAATSSPYLSCFPPSIHTQGGIIRIKVVTVPYVYSDERYR